MDHSDATSQVAPSATAMPADAPSIVLHALRGESLDAFDALAASSEPAALQELAASEHGQAWAQVPRHLVPDDARLVILHGAARLYRYDGEAIHLDGDFFEAIVRCLETGDGPWAEQAGMLWIQLVLHIGESPTVWPHARTLLERFPDEVHDRPGLLSGIASIASLRGEPVADELWERVLAHPSLGDNAARRWERELEWARSHLLLAAGEPARAMKVITRARKGFADLGTSTAELRWVDATLELVAGLAWLGRHEESMAVVGESLRRVPPGGELEVYLRVTASYPAAALGDASAVDDAESALRQAATDTSIVELRTVVPARLVAAMHRGDAGAVRDIVANASGIELGSPLDVEARLNWRVVATEVAYVLGDHALARSLATELEAELDALPFEMPVHRLRLTRVSAALDGELDTARAAKLDATARRQGVHLPSLEAPASASGDAVAEHALHVRLLGDFDVRIDNDAVDEHVWASRRQARVLFALLVVQRGSIATEEIAELLWGSVDERTLRGRLGPLGASIRAILAEAGHALPARELDTRGGRVTLTLHPSDRSDLDDLRAVADRVRREPARARDAAAEALRCTTRRPVADLGSDRATLELRDAIEREVGELVPVLASAWDGMAAPAVVLDAVRRVVDADPTDAEACARLMVLLRDRDDAPGASESYHRLRRALDEELGLAPPAFVTQLHTAIITAAGHLTTPT